MKKLKSANIYRGSNVYFDADRVLASSYDWWIFVKKLANGLVIFNTHPYSPTTRRHQQKVRALMRENNIQIHAEVETKHSLLDARWPDDAIVRCEEKLAALKALIKKPKTRASKNMERVVKICALTAKKTQLKNLSQMKGAV